MTARPKLVPREMVKSKGQMDASIVAARQAQLDDREENVSREDAMYEVEFLGRYGIPEKIRQHARRIAQVPDYD
jgi:hypothetical protein